MTDAIGGVSLSAEETAYFESGGETEIKDAGGSSETAGAEGDGGGAAGGADKPAAEAKPAGKPENDHVPLATFLSEKTARKELEKTSREMATQLAELRGKFSILDRLNKPAGEQEQPAPTVDDDIFGVVKNQGETIAQLQKRLDDEKTTKEASDKAATENQTFVNSYRADADKFKATAPDYMDAYNHLLQSRAAELLSIGYDSPADPLLTPDEKQAAAKALHDALTADEFGIAQLAFSKGKSPAQIIYDLAQKRGYAKKGAAPAADAGEDPPVADAGEDRLETIARGQAANKTLSNAGGPGGEQEMTGEQLLAMSVEDFESWTEKNPAKARRIMGG